MSSGYPPDWNKRRKEVYSRDDYTCQNCGAAGGEEGMFELHAHHIVPKSKGGTHNTSNLVTVCSKCHKSIHYGHEARTREEASKSKEKLISDILSDSWTLPKSEDQIDKIQEATKIDEKLVANNDLERILCINHYASKHFIYMSEFIDLLEQSDVSFNEDGFVDEEAESLRVKIIQYSGKLELMCGNLSVQYELIDGLLAYINSVITLLTTTSYLTDIQNDSEIPHETMEELSDELFIRRMEVVADNLIYCHKLIREFMSVSKHIDYEFE